MTDYQPKSEFLQIMLERGFVHQCTDLASLDFHLESRKPRSAYIGFDATADSLHVGSLVQIMMLQWFQDCGHRPIVLMGGGTTRVGDPSGKDETRQLLSQGTIDNNIKQIFNIFKKYLVFEGGRLNNFLWEKTVDKEVEAIQLNNNDWLDELNYVDFLREIGPHFTINRMMTMESVKTRLDREQPLTFLEFNYMLLQSYDFLQLHSREDCILQMGGSDQWGNIVNGVDLIRRVDGEPAFGLTTNLLTKADGSKMGKTASGAIWLNEDKLSAFDFWQFWRNTMDEDVGKFLKLFTKLPIDECDRLGALQGEEINEAKIILADNVCDMCHGERAARKVKEAAGLLFEKGDSIYKPPRILLEQTMTLSSLLVNLEFAKGGKDAKRLIAEGIVLINDEVIKDPQHKITLDKTEPTNVSIGKKRQARVKFEG